MRKFGILVAGATLMLMSVALVEGQQQDKKKGGGFGGFGGFGGGFGGGNNPYNLFNRSDVKKELDITDEQSDKLPAEIMAAISRVLTEKQFKRFKQLELQKKGNNAFKDAGVQKSLSLTDDQKKSVASILDDSAKEVQDAFKGGGFGKGGGDKIASINKDAKEKIFNVLTKDQRKSWREMVGEEFKFEQGGFGGFGGFGGKGGKGGKGKDTPKDK